MVVGGTGRGTFYKRTPKVFRDSIGKYSYDQTGALLLFEWYPEDHETLYIREFQLCSSHYSYRIVYYVDGCLSNIAFQRYQQGRIVEHETVTLRWWKELRHIDIKRGNCTYSDGQLRECLNEEYLSGAGTGGLLQRRKYSFVSDEEGFLKGHRVEELWGDGRRRYLFQGKLCDDSDHFYEFTDKARKDTGKDAWRWRVSNYFIL